MDILAKIFGKRFLYGIIISVLFLLTLVFLFALLSRGPEGAQAQKAFFYPETCLGGWKSAKNVSGVPEAIKDLDYNNTNSAIFEDGDSAIFCGEFKGELPPQTYQTRVTLRFSWQQEVLEPAIIEEPSILDTIVDIFAGEEESPEATSVDTDSGSSSDGDVDSVDTVATITSEVVEVATTTQEILDEVATSTEAVEEEVLDEAMEGDSTTEETSSNEEAVNEVEEISAPEPEPEPAPEPASETGPVSWWRSFVGVVYAEELIATSTKADEVVEVATTTQEVLYEVASSTAELGEEGTTTAEELVQPEIETPAESNDAIFAVEYTLDGETWQHIGYVTTVDNDVRFELPSEALVSIEDVNEVQIALRPLLRYDNMPAIYLDSMWFEISYAPVRELGVHALSSLVPEEITFEEFFNTVGTINASTTLVGMNVDQFLASTTFIHGLDSRYAIAGVVLPEVTELWLLDVDLKKITRIGFNEAAIGSYPLGAKERMIFWLNYDASIIFTYDLRTGGSLHEMALVGNLPEADERRFTFPFTDWQIVWRAEEFYFFKDSPGEVFKDEDSKSAERFKTYLTKLKETKALEEQLKLETSTTTNAISEEMATTTETQLQNENN